MTRLTSIPETPVTVDRTFDGKFAVYALTGDGVRSLGRHATPAAAWHAIDAIDLGEAAPALSRAA